MADKDKWMLPFSTESSEHGDMQYVDYPGTGDKVKLDGTFTLGQLEKLIESIREAMRKTGA